MRLRTATHDFVMLNALRGTNAAEVAISQSHASARRSHRQPRSRAWRARPMPAMPERRPVRRE